MRIRSKYLTALFGGVFMVCGMGYALAATYTVTKTADTNDGTCNTDCSLREAVIASNTNAGPDIITLRGGIYILTLIGADENNSATGDLDINGDLTINGVGGRPYIDGNLQDRVFDMKEGITVNITNVGIINGFLVSDSGAGIYTRGKTTLDNVHFTGNVVAGGPGAPGAGGAIQSRSAVYPYGGQLTILNSYFSNNCAPSGGAMDGSGDITIINSRFDGNVPVVKSGMNCSSGDGAALHFQYGNVVTIDQSTFINNVGGMGAINIWSADLTITNTTITNNRGTVGPGGISKTHGVTTVKNSTIANNTGAYLAGGISTGLSYGPEPLPPIILVNSIVANNNMATGGVGAADCAGNIMSNGNNIFGAVVGCNVALQTSDLVGNPQLGTVITTASSAPNIQQSYLPLLTTSPAIDSANNAACPTKDQLGTARPVDGNGDGTAVCDRGAHELIRVVNADVCPVGCRHSSIQAALNAAPAGATVRVGAGTYYEAVTVSNGKTLLSVNGALNTVINATGKARRGVILSPGVLDGFTVTGGAGGVGVTLSGTVRNNRIISNTTAMGGGGIIVDDYSSALIEKNTINNNRATYGGGIAHGHYSSVSIINNTIAWNTALECGGGIHFPSYANETIRSNKIIRNSAKNGGGLCINAYSALLLTNMLIVNNFAQVRGGGIYAVSYSYANILNSTITGNGVPLLENGAGIFHEGYSSLKVSNSIVWGNLGVDIYQAWAATVTYSILGAEYGSSNIIANPLFVNAAAGDFRLQNTSPAIDTGRSTAADGVTHDIDGVTRPQDGNGLGKGSTGDGSDYDIGAYEFRR